jgi:hypothetical protein
MVSLAFLSAVDNSTTNSTTTSSDPFDKSYTCLNNQLATKDVTTLTQDELSFSLLATAYNSTIQDKLKTELLSREDTTNNCWPKSGCTIRDTAIALSALDYIHYDTTNIRNWLSNQTMAPPNLIWYLQIDSDASQKATCNITINSGTPTTVYVNQDKTITGNPGSCFYSAYNNFWLQVNPNCYNKNITISCDQDFLIATHFRKSSDTTYYLSTTTQTAPVGGSVQTAIQSICFKQSGSCNYEGSLWASSVLNKQDSNLMYQVLPYIMTSASDNQRYLPSAFLYMLTGYDNYFGDLTNLQNQNGYWQVSDTSRRYYDTAVALLALNGKAGQADLAKQYLTTPTIQGNGCWNNNIADTAFILYAAASKPAVSSSGIAVSSKCADFGYSCTTSLDCDRNNGTSLSNFACSFGYICCNATIAQQTCSGKGGSICSVGQTCSSGGLSLASDTSYCCISGTCVQNVAPTTTDCANQGASYSCKSQCYSSEKLTTFDCGDATLVCCNTPTSSSKSYWWIWVLVLLIILLILVYIFRNQLKVWIFKRDSGFSKSNVNPQTRPPFPPTSQRPMMGSMPRRIIPGQMPPRQAPGMMKRPPFPKDRELDETLKKLKDMSK